MKKCLNNGRLPELVSELDWYALLVPPQKEFAAQEILSKRDIATFCPFQSVWRRPSRYSKDKVLKHYPVMPRYLFAGFAGQVDWYRLFQMPLINAVVGVAGEPRCFDNMGAFIRNFRNGLRRPGHDRHMPTHREFGVGDTAVIVDSALAGRHVVVESIDKGHAFFTLEMFGGEMRLSLPTDKLEAA